MWFKLNAKLMIQVATLSGLTEKGKPGKQYRQGSAGAELDVQVDINLGNNCNCSWKDRTYAFYSQSKLCALL